jgi:hypothetical protein
MTAPTKPAASRAGLPRDLEIRFDRAVRRIAAAKSQAERDLALKAREAVLEEAARRADAAWTQRAQIEQDTLERMRGGVLIVEEIITDVPVLDDKGAHVWKRGRKKMRQERVLRPRLTNRDGLETLLKAQALTARQYAAGMRYRGLYEACDHTGGLTPPEPGGARGGGGPKPFLKPGTTTLCDPKGVTSAILAAHSAEELHDAELAVLVTNPASTLRTLRQVAGEARTISSMCRSGGRRRAINLTNGLKDALDTIADFFARKETD